jgi:CheY-like chemotaxis protein
MSQDLRVLLVAANSAVRALLVGSISTMAEVAACGGVAEALRQANPEPPDLIIADYRLPRLSGMELIFQLRACFPNLPAILLATREEAHTLLATPTAVVEEIIEKPFFLDEATQRIRRVLERIALHRQAQATHANSLHGTLQQMSVVDLLQTLDLGHKSCRLRLTHRGLSSQMHFVDGQLLHATFGPLSGEAAVFPVIGWSEGAFAIEFVRENCPQTIERSTQSLLLEALRRYDEAQRDAALALAAPHARRQLYPAVAPQAPPPGCR